MSDKVCCNCRHNIRHYEDKGGPCYCDIDNHYIGYVQCMEHWCKHWSKEEKNMKEMTVEQYRERLIQAFQNTGNDNLIALVALPNEKDFKAMESLLRNFWNKKEEGEMNGGT